jgi:hypothetical protein
MERNLENWRTCKNAAADIDFLFEMMYNVYGLSGVLWHIALAPSSYWRSCLVLFNFISILPLQVFF